MTGETFGEGLRRWRGEVNGLSLRDLAARSNVSKTRISDLENGRPPGPSIAKRLDDVLGANGALLALAAGGAPMEALTVARSVPFDVYRHADLATRLLAGGMGGSADMDRRSFVLGLGGTATLGMIAPFFGMETARHGLTLALVQERSTADVDEWREIVEEYGYDYMRLPPDELIQPLMIDLLSLQMATARAADEAVGQELRKAGALLAAFTAMTVANLGHVREARRWWRSARRIAGETRDPDTILWVYGREVVRSLYEVRPVLGILDLAERAEVYVATGRTDALPELVSGKAQALALAGRSEEALATLNRVRDVYDRLPSRTIAEQESIFDWPENRLRFTESYVYSHLGDLAHADAAQDRAVRVYPRQYLRGPAQIELQRALCLVKAGDISGGAWHAQQIIEQLPAKDRIRPVIDLGYTVLRNVPLDERQLPAVEDLRDHLTSIEASGTS